MLKIGLTGGIGSGKSVISGRFAYHGIDIIDTDIISRRLTTSCPKVLSRIKQTFGKEVMESSGVMSRNRMRQKVLNDATAKQKLETILHPEIRQQATQQILAAKSIYCVVVVPLLVETNFHELVDRVLVVETPREKRVRWLLNRGLNLTEIEKIMAAQASNTERARFADDVLINDGDMAALHDRVDHLHKFYASIAK